MAGRLLGKGTGETRGCGLLGRWALLPPGWLVAVLGRPHPLPGPEGRGAASSAEHPCRFQHAVPKAVLS